MRHGSLFFEGESFGQSGEVLALGQLDGDLGVDLLTTLPLDVLLLNTADVGQAVLAEDLRCFENERDALAHSLNLQVSML
jgi:hypothetical protein